jgi:hypothetical protein
MSHRRVAPRWWPGIFVIVAILSACGGGDDETSEAEPTAVSDEGTEEAEPTVLSDEGTDEATPLAPFELTSPAFTAGATIPDRYSCDGEDISPELAWTDPPEGTATLALLMDDPDAVPVAGKVWDHWVVWGLPGEARALPEAVPVDEVVVGGGTQGLNSFGLIGYGGPCPPADQTHEYVFVLYAIDIEVDPAGPTKQGVLDAMEGHILAEAVLTGSFGR